MADEAPADGNFAHVGCLVGSIVGLSAGVVLAWIVTVRTGSIVWAMLTWVVLTVALAAIGYLLGERRPRPAS